MNKSANQFNHLKVLSIKTYDKLQSGFVLLVVFGCATFHQWADGTHDEPKFCGCTQCTLSPKSIQAFISADKAVMNLWQLSPKHLVHMAQTDTWLASLLSDKDDLTKFIQLKAVMTGKHLVSVRLMIRQHNAITLYPL